MLACGVVTSRRQVEFEFESVIAAIVIARHIIIVCFNFLLLCIVFAAVAIQSSSVQIPCITNLVWLWLLLFAHNSVSPNSLFSHFTSPGGFRPRGPGKNKNTAQSKPAQYGKHIPPYKKWQETNTAKAPFTNKGEMSYNIPCGYGLWPLYRWAFTCAGLRVLAHP